MIALSATDALQEEPFRLSCTTWSFRPGDESNDGDTNETSDAALTDSETSDEEVNTERKIHNGCFTDFVYRKRPKTKEFAEQDYDTYISQLLLGAASAGVSNAVLRDDLLRELEDAVAPFKVQPMVTTRSARHLQAAAAAGAFEQHEPKGAETFLEYARWLCKVEREALCLRVEVTNRIIREKILKVTRGTQVKHVESQDERKARLKGFWTEFHSKPQKRQPQGRQPESSVNCTAVECAADELADAPALEAMPEQDLARKTMRSSTKTSTKFPPLGKNDLWKQRSSCGLPQIKAGREDKPLSKFQSMELQPMGSLAATVKAGRRNLEATSSSSSSPQSFSEKWKMSKRGDRSMGRTLINQPGLGKCVSLPELHTGRSPKQGSMSSTLLQRSKSCTNVASPTSSRSQAIERSRSEPKIDATHLPAIVSPKKMPWQSEGCRQQSCKAKSPTEVYLNACEEYGVVPGQMQFVCGQSSKLLASDLGLGDHDVLPIVTMMASLKDVEEVDLSGNVNLTEKSLVPLLNCFFGTPTAKSLRALKLKQCLRLSVRSAIQNTMDIIVQMLTEEDGVRFLHGIDLSGIPMGTRSQFSLCQAIRQHAYLRVAHLSDIGLTGKAAMKCIYELTNAATLETLDLSWNCFSKDVFLYMGERIVNDKTIKSLCLSNCSGACNAGSDNPMLFMLEQLSRASSLTHLNISMNRLDFRGGFVLEDALERNRALVELDISYNPLGVLGMRSLLRLLSRETSGLLHFECEDCFSSLQNLKAAKFQPFSATHPGGKYVLDLQHPYDRAMLRMFYKTSERFSVSPAASFQHVKYSGKTFEHASKDRTGVWEVPSEGSLTMTFNLECAFNAGGFAGIDSRDFASFLAQYFSKTKVLPGFKKLVPLMAKWAENKGRTVDQSAMLQALSHDFRFTYPHMKEIRGNCAMPDEAVIQLWPCVLGEKRSKYLTLNLLPSVECHVQLLARHRNSIAFNAQNPTGHYTLDLGNPGDYGVAQQILLLDRWEASLSSKSKRHDTSQRGNGSHVRNEKYNDQTIRLHSLAEWIVPQTGWFQLDYSSGQTPPSGAMIVGEHAFSRLLLGLQKARISDSEQIQVIRQISHSFWLTSLQVREILGLFRSETMRADLFVTLFSRITDIHNEKQIRVRFEKRCNLQEIRNRLGHIVYFPFVQPEQTWFELDLSIYDQRVALNLLFQICAKENWVNLTQFSYTHHDGRLDPLTLGLPRSWEHLDRMPEEGTFRGCYACAPEDRNYQIRKNFLEAYTSWRAPSVDEVRWWAVLTETPEDVLHYLEFLVARFPDIWAAFRYIDKQIHKDGSISLREFEESMKILKCIRFDGPDKQRRMNSIFRYLDPSGEGQVSEGEWGIMDLLFKEMTLSIKEFVQFLVRTYGDDLQAAWKVLDADDSGEIDASEWETALHDVGFFGPSRCIFSFMDKDDGGSISHEEFEALADFKYRLTPQEKRRSVVGRMAGLPPWGSPG